MRRPRAGLRLGVMLLFLLGLLSPVAATGVGAQDLSCDDFNTQQAAQAVLDADPSLEDDLDPDGDGIACNEDEGANTGESTEEAEETPDDESTEEAEETPDDNGSSEDGDAYLADIQDEVDTVVESFDRFAEINETFADADEDEQIDLVAELEEIAEGWADYPSAAEEFEAPAGFEDVGDAYTDFADAVGEAGDTWLTWWDIPQGDPEEDAAFDDFTVAFDDAQSAADDVYAAIDDAGGANGNGEATEESTEEATEEATEEGTEEATDDEYLGTIQDEVDTLTEQVDRFLEIDQIGADATEDEVAELNQIAEDWSNYPDDVAAEIPEPDDDAHADVYDAYMDLADLFGESGDLWADFWATESGSPEEADALDAFNETFIEAQDQILVVQDLIDDAGGSSNNGEEPTEEATEESNGGDVDAEEYLATVSDTAADWNDSIDRFNELFTSGDDLTDADIEEVTGIITLWMSAPSVAAEVEAPEGLEDVQSAYEDYADELANAGTAFTTWIASEPDSTEADDALDEFLAAIDSADTLYADLEDLLADAE